MKVQYFHVRMFSAQTLKEERLGMHQHMCIRSHSSLDAPPGSRHHGPTVPIYIDVMWSLPARDLSKGTCFLHGSLTAYQLERQINPPF